MAKLIKKFKLELGKKIQKIRKNVDLTQEELADMLKISRTHMGHIEQGRKSPSLKLLEKIARVLKIPISELFTYKK